jgi:hypothetical protein
VAQTSRAGRAEQRNGVGLRDAPTERDALARVLLLWLRLGDLPRHVLKPLGKFVSAQARKSFPTRLFAAQFLLNAQSLRERTRPGFTTYARSPLPARSDYDLRCEKTAPAAPSMHAIRRPSTIWQNAWRRPHHA